MTTTQQRSGSPFLIDEFVLSISSHRKRGLLKRKRAREDKETDNASPTKRLKLNEINPLPETTEYLVETILGKRKINGIWQYLIKWDGYDPEFNTWEDEYNLNCPDLLAEFENKMVAARKENANKREEKEEEGLDASFGTGQKCLKLGTEIQEILNVQVIDNQLMYYITGNNTCSYVPAQIVDNVAPNQVVSFFASRLQFSNPM